MKKLVLMSLLFVSIFGFSQTTRKDYNYMSKGYWIAESNGYDKRKDRAIVSIWKTENEQAKVTVMQMCNSDSTGCYCYSVFIEDKKSDKSTYITVPSPKSEKTMIDEFQSNVSNLNNVFSYYFILAQYYAIRFK